MNEDASAGEEHIQSPSLLSANERRIRRAAEILGFSSRLDPRKDHRLMIPKECPLARTINLLITTQPLRGGGRGWGGYTHNLVDLPYIQSLPKGCGQFIIALFLESFVVKVIDPMR